MMRTIAVFSCLFMVPQSEPQSPHPVNPNPSIALHVCDWRLHLSKEWYDDAYVHAVGRQGDDPSAKHPERERNRVGVKLERSESAKSVDVTVDSIGGRQTSGDQLLFHFTLDAAGKPRVDVTGTWKSDVKIGDRPSNGVLSDLSGDVWINTENILSEDLCVSFALTTTAGSSAVLMGAFRAKN